MSAATWKYANGKRKLTPLESMKVYEKEDARQDLLDNQEGRA